MSKYTTELRYICEHLAEETESKPYSSVEDIITTAAPLIFSFTFPIFDSNYKLPLEKKILKHFYTREIGLETYGLWKLKLDAKMNEIMPYYNKLYESELLRFNPFDTENRTKIFNRNESGTESRSGTNNSNSSQNSNAVSTNNDVSNELNKYSDTPQSSQDFQANKYITELRQNDMQKTNINQNIGSATSSEQGGFTSNGSVGTTEQYIEQYVGKSGSESYSKLLREFRASFMNIDMDVINELEELFMGVW